MTNATLNYLNHIIEVNLPNPDEDNTIYVSISRQEGTYDVTFYNSYLKDFQFSAQSKNPNDWILEALQSSIQYLNNWETFYQKQLQSRDDDGIDSIF